MKQIEPTEYEFNNMINEGVYAGIITVYSLPETLFSFNYLNTMSGVLLGAGDYTDRILQLKRMQLYKENISFFSGAKTWQHVNELTQHLYDDAGKKVAFSQFKEVANKVNSLYNKNFLKTELNTGFAVSQGSTLWQNFEEDKNILPLLQYQTVGDSRVRSEHASWDNIIKPVDDEFWSSHMPPNDWSCRCTVIQIRDGKETDLNEHLKKYNKGAAKDMQVNSLNNTSKMFKSNPGKDDYIFKKTHPYNDIPKSFSKAQNENFGLVTPDNDELIKFAKKL